MSHEVVEAVGLADSRFDPNLTVDKRGGLTYARAYEPEEAAMPTDLAVTVEDKPGELASLGEATGRAGINLEGMCCFACEGRFIVHLLVDDPDATRRAVEGAGYTSIEERDVAVVGLEDRPGALGETTRKIADANVNIELAYLATNSRLVVGAADLDKVKAVV